MKKILLLVLIFTFTKSFSQTTITLQPNAAVGKDALIWDLDPNSTSGGTIQDFDAEAWTWSGNPGKYRSLIEFNLTTIPTNAVVQSAHLYLYFNPTSGNGSQHSQLSGSNASWLRRITASWQENTVNWNNQPATTTVNQVNVPANTTPQQNYIIDVAAPIQDMVSSPSTNYGFMFMLQTEQYYRTLIFASSDHPDSTIHPKLVVTYTVPNCTTLILQPDASAGKDALLWDLDPNSTSGGTIQDFDAEAWTWSGTPGIYRSLIEFNLSSIPPGSTVQSANLSLYFNPTSGNGSQHSQLSGSNISWLKRITSPWLESTVNWNNQPSTTTLNQVSVHANTAPQENYIIDVTAPVQVMVDTPSTNYGFMFMLQTEQYYRTLIFASSDHPTAALHPKLEVCYTSGIGVGEVSSLGQIKIFPNPSNGNFMITSGSTFKNGTIEVFNSLGQEIYNRKIAGAAKEEVNLNAAAGIYFVKVNDGEKVFTRKLIIE